MKNEQKRTIEKTRKGKHLKKAWVVTVDMGYGHQRAAYALRDLSYGDIITANNYQGIPKRDQKIWNRSQKFYEHISRAKYLPIIGDFIFSLFDRWQAISPFYPKRDLSISNFQTRQTYRLIQKGWGKDLIQYLNQKPLPLVTTFFVPAFMAEVHKYKGDIYCEICDADIARNWAPLYPKKSRIKYFAPNIRVLERLRMYGIPQKNIFLTGFSLPKENIGGYNLSVLKKDLAARLYNLDPNRRFIKNYKDIVDDYLGKNFILKKPHHPLTLTFAVGGAGAQRELGRSILKSLSPDIKTRKIRLNLVAGIRNDVYNYFKSAIETLGLKRYFGRNVFIIFDINKNGYFRRFNQILRTTDILWTKPSELTFFTALGIPIIMAPPIGCQELFNQRWLEHIGGGIKQSNPKFTREWLSDWLKSGWLAEAGWQGFLDAPKFGTYKIEDIVLGRGARTVKEVGLI